MGRSTRWGYLIAVTSFFACDAAHGAIAGLTRVASGLSSPMFVTHAPGDRTRLFIGQRSGAIRILNLTTGNLETTPFLSIPSVDAAGEGGLLGMAFHPEYATNGKFYVNVTIDNGGLVFQGATSPFSTHIRQYTRSSNPNIAINTPTPILSFIQPQDNHNGGWIGFSPNNGYLYIPTGDGGSGNDTGSGHTPGTGNAQDITDNLLGKVVRIDVNGDDYPSDANRNYAIPANNPYRDTVDDMGMPVVVTGDDEIWASGLRNPFRDSFDRLTGDLWLGDVGQGTREEIDRQPADATPGENFGWRIREGNTGGTAPANYRAPVYDYGRTGDFGGKTVIGGYVYRGPDPDLQGKYFFADGGDFGNVASQKFWTFDIDNPTGTVVSIKSQLTPNAGSLRYPSAFGEDAVGNLYIVSLETNEVFRINTNNLIAGDYNSDGFVNDDDYAVWQANFGSTVALAADGNDNNIIDAADYNIWRDNLGNSVHELGAGSGGIVAPEPSSLALGLLVLFTLLGVRRRARMK